MKALKLLLLEDYLDIGELLAEGLTEAGFTVAWFVRARRAQEDIIVMDADGRETKLDPSAYDVALVDGKLKMSALDGWELTPLLVKSGLTVVAVSGDPNVNRHMIELGACRSMEKFDVLRLVRDGALDCLPA